MSFIRTFLCFLNWHENKYEFQDVLKTKISETTNVKVTCKYCGIIIDEYGTTTVGPFSFSVGNPPEHKESR